MLFNRLDEIEKLTRSILIYTVSKFPYYTPHNFKHSLNVEENLNWLVPDDKKMELNSHEIFFLIISSWLHDWGMIGSANEEAEKIRENHHVRTEENLEKFHDKIRLSLNEGRIIGRICRGHRKENLLDPKFDDLFFRSNIRVRIRFLSALLRIADECDVTENRVPEVLYYNLSPKGASEEEFRKHLSIIGIGQPEPYKLQLSGVARDPKGAEVLEEVRKRIQDELNNVKAILAKENIILDYVELRVDTRGFINKPIEFMVDREKIVNLLMGENLYHRFDVGIRELLQNSLDACRLRDSLEKGYTPLITFSYGKERISVEDNGIGMSFDTASRYLSNIGASFFVSKEFEDMKAGKVTFDPISRFGIGILSCFLIASKVIIETLKKNKDPCRFVIEDLAEGWRYEAGSRKTVGTEISLILNEKGKQIVLENVLKHHAKAVEFPIQVINEDTGQRKLLQQQWDCTMDEIRERVRRRHREDLSELLRPTFSRTIKTEGIEAVYYFFERTPLLFSNNYFLSYHGLYVGNFSLCNCLNERLIVLVNCTKSLVDLAVSRESLVENDKYYNFIEQLYENFFKFLEEDLVERTKNKKSSEFDKLIIFAEICNKFFNKNVVISSLKEQEILLARFAKMTYPVLDTKGFHLLKGESIFSRKGIEKIYRYSLGLEECQYHIKTVETLLKEILGMNDIAVFDLIPKIFFGFESEPQKMLHYFESLCEKKNIKCELSDLLKLLSQKKFNRISTPLDQLLPENSFFTKLPPQFRSFVIFSKKFDFGEESKRYPIVENLSMRELFTYDADISKYWDARVREDMERYNIKCPCQKKGPAEFIFDIDDLVIKFMLEKSSLILSNSSMRQIVEGYFCYLCLLTCTLSFLYFTAPEYQLSILTVLEKSILSLLGYKGVYKPLLERMGSMSRAFSYYIFYESPIIKIKG